MLGKGGLYAETCRNENFIGADYAINQDLTGKLPDEWRVFNKEFIPIYLSNHPDKSKIAAGLACGMLWTICKGLQVGDIVLCPNGNGEYYVGVITGNYFFKPNEILHHRRPVKWVTKIIHKTEISDELKRTIGSYGTCCDVSQFSNEIESLINSQQTIISCSNTNVENPMEFAMEKHLENFLIKNWANTSLGKKYNVFEENGELVGQQYPTDTGEIDVLAISKDQKELLIIELKRGRTTDVVIGQIQRYMGYVKEELAEPNQVVKGIIIGLEADTRLKRALVVTNNIEFYKYQIDFKLQKEIY